jgi:hypothetical protein
VSQVRRAIDRRTTLLFLVRHGDSDTFRWLRATFAGQPVWVAWDRRLPDGRPVRHRLAPERRRSEPRNTASPLSLRRLRFIAVALPIRPDRQAS